MSMIEDRSPTPSRGLWAIRVLALAACGIAGYLLALALSKQGLPAGCGAGSGCAEVLNSRWSNVLGVPVTAPALAAYLAILTASFFPRSSFAWLVMLTAAAAVVGAAGWFMALQFAVLKSICPWCMVEHAVGGVLAVVVAVLAISLANQREGVPSPLAAVASMMLGLFFVGLLAAGQAFIEVRSTVLIRLPDDRNADTGPGADRQISVLKGSLPLIVSQEPLLGDPQARHLVVILFDYCCPHCRETHGHVLKGLKKYRGQYALVLLPMPLDKSCNSHVDETEPRFENACQLAKLALAVWNADRAKFEEFDRWLFEPEQPRALDEATRKAQSLVGADRLRETLSDPAIEKSLQRNIAAYDRSAAGRIPVILSPEFAAIVGRPADEQQLFEILEKELRLKP